MDTLMNFQLGWLNKERLLFLIGIAFLLIGLTMFIAGGSAEKELKDKVLFEKSANLDTPILMPYDIKKMSDLNWTSERLIFLLLDAPQLEIDPPSPPDISESLVLPPPFPQPSSKGSSQGKGGVE